LQDANLASAVVIRPNSSNTIRYLQLSLVTMMPGIPRPLNVSLDWFANSSSVCLARFIMITIV
jgi:hypothetical protein